MSKHISCMDTNYLIFNSPCNCVTRGGRSRLTFTNQVSLKSCVAQYCTQPKIFRDDTYPFTAMYDTDMNAVLNQDCSCNNQ